MFRPLESPFPQPSEIGDVPTLGPSNSPASLPAAPLTASALTAAVQPLARQAVRAAVPTIAWVILKPVLLKLVQIVIDLVLAELTSRSTGRSVSVVSDSAAQLGDGNSIASANRCVVVYDCQIALTDDYEPTAEAEDAWEHMRAGQTAPSLG